MFGPTDIIFPDGGTVQGDRLVILPEGAPPVSSLSAVKVMASQIPQIIITSEQVRELGVPLWVGVGIRSYVCLLFGACQIGIDAPTTPAESARTVPADARWINGRLQLSFLAEPPDKTNVFTISDDIVLSVATAQALGHQQVTVHAGSYPMDYSVNPHGQVSPDVTVQGIVIGGTFTIGRKSLNCRRFGFCRLEEVKIEFELPSESRTIPGGITWVNGHLQFNFLAEPPDKTNVLTIDEDIVLDTVLAQSLGYQHITVLAGNYPMDYAVNPHGAVSPDVTAQDVVIGGTFTIGRKRYGCERFGLCRLEEIKIEFELGSDARTIPGGFTWHNGQLDLNFLAEPPGKTNVLTIDEDIVLDSVLAQSLGYQRLTVLAGDYPMDYSVNPHGQVSPRVSTTSVTILQNTNGTITIAWPADATNLELEGTDNISPPIVWLPVNGAVQEMNGRRVVTLPISSTPRFFRLRGPGGP